jgi:L-alanine-DL-glutamate epimerase-like enolase superfamily enzyme
MNIVFQTFDLQMRHRFTISRSSRTFTPLVLTQISLGEAIGRGEASLPPYLPENQATVTTFLEKANVLLANKFKNINAQNFDYQVIEQIMDSLETLSENDTAAKASIDIALHNLWAALQKQKLWQLWHINPEDMPPTSCTLGMDTPSVIREKVTQMTDFHVLKVKLGSEDDKILIETIREMTDKPLYVDANAGWNDREKVLDLIYWLQSKNTILIEQPMAKENLDDHAWLREKSPLPIFADESFQRLRDLAKIKDAFHGVNIKLMKCTGLREARKIIVEARKNDLKIMIGCMSETSCAIMAAAQIAPLVDFVDLDSTWLTTNNPFEMPILRGGKICLD